MDTIERHFASDLLDVIKEKVDKGEPFPYENAKRFIEKLPAAQPEPCEDAVSKETIIILLIVFTVCATFIPPIYAAYCVNKAFEDKR